MPRVNGRPHAVVAIDGQRAACSKARSEVLLSTRDPNSAASLKAERASLAAKRRQAETKAAPIRYVAELVGTGTDSERSGG
jgi:hypothetical protein